MSRIREILDDAEVIWDKPDAHNPLALVSLEEFKEILETVVKECAEVCLRWNHDVPYTDEQCAAAIIEHFGVEE
jgi:hypothetical protein